MSGEPTQQKFYGVLDMAGRLLYNITQSDSIKNK
jgi:hypothetical protein